MSDALGFCGDARRKKKETTLAMHLPDHAVGMLVYMVACFVVTPGFGPSVAVDCSQVFVKTHLSHANTLEQHENLCGVSAMVVVL